MLHDILSIGVENRGIDLDQGYFGHFNSEFLGVWLGHAITCNGFELESPNLQWICILRFYWLVLNTGVIDLDLQGHLAISSQDSKKQHSPSLFYTDLGQPRGVTRPNILLLIITLPMTTLYVSYKLVNFVSGNGLLHVSTKPLPAPILTPIQWGPVAFMLE